MLIKRKSSNFLKVGGSSIFSQFSYGFQVEFGGFGYEFIGYF